MTPEGTVTCATIDDELSRQRVTVTDDCKPSGGSTLEAFVAALFRSMKPRAATIGAEEPVVNLKPTSAYGSLKALPSYWDLSTITSAKAVKVISIIAKATKAALFIITTPESIIIKFSQPSTDIFMPQNLENSIIQF
jgi:hypothetical protein